jgi:hypothetical protein
MGKKEKKTRQGDEARSKTAAIKHETPPVRQMGDHWGISYYEKI